MHLKSNILCFDHKVNGPHDLMSILHHVYTGLVEQCLLLCADVLLIDSDCLVRQCCGSSRPFAMRIFDNNQREVIHVERPLRCWLQTVEVQSPPGTIIGYVEQVREWQITSWYVIFISRIVLLSILGSH